MFASLVHGCYVLVALSDLQPSVPRSIVSALLCADDEIAAAVHALAVLVYFMTIFAHGHLINPTKQACGHSLEFLSQCRDAIDCPAWMMVGPSWCRFEHNSVRQLVQSPVDDGADGHSDMHHLNAS